MWHSSWPLALSPLVLTSPGPVIGSLPTLQWAQQTGRHASTGLLLPSHK